MNEPPTYGTRSPDGTWWWDGHGWAPVPQPPASLRWLGCHPGCWAALLVVLVILYVAFHAMKYRNCLVQPGELDWPTVCF